MLYLGRYHLIWVNLVDSFEDLDNLLLVGINLAVEHLWYAVPAKRVEL